MTLQLLQMWYWQLSKRSFVWLERKVCSGMQYYNAHTSSSYLVVQWEWCSCWRAPTCLSLSLFEGVRLAAGLAVYQMTVFFLMVFVLNLNIPSLEVFNLVLTCFSVHQSVVFHDEVMENIRCWFSHVVLELVSVLFDNIAPLSTMASIFYDTGCCVFWQWRQNSTNDYRCQFRLSVSVVC